MRPSLPLLLVAGCLKAATPADALFEQSHEAFRAGKFADAAARLETILAEHGASAAVHLNLAHSYFQLSTATGAGAPRLGWAIQHCHEALRLAPRDERGARTLQAIRAHVHGQAPRPTLAASILGHFSINEWTFAASLALTAWSLLVVLDRAMRARGCWQAALRPWLPVLGTSALLLILVAALAWREQSWVRRGVAVRDSQVYKRPLAPGDVPELVAHTEPEPLRDGMEVRVVDERPGGWWKVRFASGMNTRGGWVRSVVGGEAPLTNLVRLPR